MNKKNLKIIFDNYAEKFDLMNDEVHQEYFKWEVFEHFKKEWNKGHKGFALKLKNALDKTDILINSKMIYPATGLIKLAEIPQEEAKVEAMLNSLIETEDGGDIAKRQQRIESFVTEANEILARYEPRSWKYKQNFRSALLYLNLLKPMENYIYKYSEARDFANFVEFSEDIGFGQTFSLVSYYRLCDELVEAIKEYPGLLDLHYSRPYLRDYQNSLEVQDNLHILAFDIIYCAHTYGLFNGIVLKESKKKASAEKKETINLEEYSDKVEEIKGNIEVLYHSLKDYENISLLNETINHKRYKQGKVISQGGCYIKVSFSSKECIFKLPDAVADGFISVSDNITVSLQECSRLQKEIAWAERSLKKLEESLRIILGS